MGVTTVVALLFLGVLGSYAVHDIPDRYDIALDLQFDGFPQAATFKFFYTYDRENQMLRMAVKVLSLGWVGIGFSRNAFMTDTDVAIGWVDSSGNGYLQDRYAFQRSLPRLDAQQDFILYNATETDGYTIIEMARPLETCDTQDDITLNVGDTMYLLFAYNDNDPAGENDIPQHQYRQSMIINLFGNIVEPPPPADLSNLDLLNENVTIPSVETTYWCKTFRLPDTIINTTHYVTAFEPVIPSNNLPHVHHILIYKCADLTTSDGRNANGPCNDVHEEATDCRDNLLIAGWAVGAGKFFYPENVAYPIGGDRGDTYLLMEMHYDNPNNSVGVVDNSGMRFSLTQTARQFNAGQSGLGAEVNSNLFVPPNAGIFNIFGYCPSFCTRAFFPEGGITVFANFLHTHTVGVSVILRHVRRGVELPPIDQNLFYDFDYQLTNHITPRVVLPGDDLIVECRYNSTGRNISTFGGESTSEEMCLSFITYYPDIPMTYCVSYPNTDQFEDWVQTHAPETLDEYRQINRLGDARNFFNNFQWTDQAFRDIEAVNLNGVHFVGCGAETTGQGSGYRGTTQRPPQIDLPYVAPDVCSRNTTGPGDGGAAQFTYSTIVVVMMAMLSFLL